MYLMGRFLSGKSKKDDLTCCMCRSGVKKFESRTATGREHFVYQDSDVSQISVLIMEKRYLAM